MTPDNFSKCITGLASCEAKLNYVVPANGIERIGKKLIILTIIVPGKRYSWNLDSDQNAMKSEIDNEIKSYFDEGWSVRNYGLTTKQENPKGHKIILERYEDANES